MVTATPGGPCAANRMHLVLVCLLLAVCGGLPVAAADAAGDVSPDATRAAAEALAAAMAAGRRAPPPPRQRGNASFAASSVSPPSTMREGEWEVSTGEKVVGPPALWEDGGIVFGWAVSRALRGGEYLLVAVQVTDGALLWYRGFSGSWGEKSMRLQQPVISVLEGHCVVYVIAGTSMYAVNNSAHDLPLWEFNMPNATAMIAPGVFQDDPTTASSVGLVIPVTHANSSSVLYAITALASGRYEQRWVHGLGPDTPRVTMPVFLCPGPGHDNVAVVVTNKRVVALDYNDGSAVWNRSIFGAPPHADPPATRPADAVNSELAYFFTVDADRMTWMYAIDPFGGKVWYTFDVVPENATSDGIVSPAVVSRQGAYVIYTISSDSVVQMVARDARDGKVKWRMIDQPNVSLSRPVLSPLGHSVYTTANSNSSVNFWAVQTDTGQLYKIRDVMSGCVDCMPVRPPYNFVVDSQGFAIVPTIDGWLFSFPAPTAVAPPPSGPTSHSSSNIGYIAGGAGLLVVLLILCASQWFSRKRKVREGELTSPMADPRKATEKSKLIPKARPGTDAESKYIALRKLGTGSFGTVYEVRCKKDKKLYALKRIPCDSEQERNEAVREWKMLCGINHPNKITAYETFVNWSAQNGNRQNGNEEDFTIRRYVCIVMEYYPEGDLKHYIRSLPAQDRPKEDVILKFSGQICSLLSVIHAQAPPLIHRDLKPENILLAENYTKVVVTDFGLARMVNRGSYLKTHAGTYAYISPETWDRHYSTGADIWALGCIMYAMASKRVGKTDCRCLWREASQVDFQDGIVREISQKYGYSERLGSIAAQLLTPDRRRRPSAVQALDWFAPYITTASPTAAAAAAAAASKPAAAASTAGAGGPTRATGPTHIADPNAGPSALPATPPRQGAAHRAGMVLREPSRDTLPGSDVAGGSDGDAGGNGGGVGDEM